MKLTCTQDNFKKAIYNTERVIGKQTTLPILENILFETDKGMLKVSATNLEIGVFLKIGAKIEKEGKITIPAKLISNFVNNLPTGDNVYLEAENGVLKIKSGNYSANIRGLDAQDFPIIPELGNKFLLSVSSKDLKENIPKLLSCVSLDNTRLELGGVNMVFGEKSLSMAATDSFRLLEIEVDFEKEKDAEYQAFVAKTSSLIVPANVFSEVFRAIDQETEEIKIAIEESQIFFQIGSVRIVSRLINGKYPEYKQIIPGEFVTKAKINKDDLLRAVRIASFFTNSKSGEVNLKINSKEKNLEILAQSEEKGENKTQMGLEIEGKDQEIVFNPRYFIDGINSVYSDEVAFLANSGSSPVVLRSIVKENEKKIISNNLTYVVMPIKN